MRTAAGSLACLLALGLGLSGCGAATGPGGTSGGAASCVGPYLDDAHDTHRRGRPGPVVAPGGTLDLRGHWYTSTCDDTGGDEPLVPLPDVTLTVTLPDGRTGALGPFTPAGDDLGFDATVRVPADAAGGEAAVSDGLGGPPYTFRVGVLPEQDAPRHR